MTSWIVNEVYIVLIEWMALPDYIILTSCTEWSGLISDLHIFIWWTSMQMMNCNTWKWKYGICADHSSFHFSLSPYLAFSQLSLRGPSTILSKLGGVQKFVLRIEDTFSMKTPEIEMSMQIWWCHSSTFEDTPYKVYIFLKLRAFCNYFQQRKTKQTYVEMLAHCELRAWGTLSQVGVSGYIEIHLLHCTTYVQCLPIFVIALSFKKMYTLLGLSLLVMKWQCKNCTDVWFSVVFGRRYPLSLNKQNVR